MGLFEKRVDEAVIDEIAEAMNEEAVEEVEEQVGDFTAEGTAYDIAYNQRQLKLYEASHPPIMATFGMYKGMLSLADLTSLVGYGLRVHGGSFVAPKTGMKIAAKLIEHEGYAPVLGRVMEALERDCGFLFAGVDD